MMLWLTIQFLFAGLVLSDASPMPEDCYQLVKPLSLTDHSMLSGTWYFIEGFTDHEPFKSRLKVLETTRVKMVLKPNNADVLQVFEEDKFNGICYGAKFSGPINGDIVTLTSGTHEMVFQLLPTCSDCMLVNSNITFFHYHQIEKMFDFPTTVGEDKFHTHSFYLMAKKASVKEEDLQQFRKQAACVGFSGDPDYHYDPSKEFCAEGEGRQMMY
ncbi:uncharacterized protein LOC117501843 isoform X1 [Thalassophryne amazonica]|uniref:uncharacterized protein LOC117501843 isoform X1 n=1 Tax=Thalassophryne amazonica TaxID=390379 RepID=UPI001470B71E|nr:uncharacterized protein LOC117501843 isoform X1 [Thalassophryne amazonica]